MSVPTDLKYTDEHEWTRLGDDEVITVGITSFAQEQLGSIVYVELPAEGSEFARADAIGQIESTKSVADLYSPASGTVVEVNRALEDTPELINSDPYEAGWLVRIKLEAPEELDELLGPEEYQDRVEEEA